MFFNQSHSQPSAKFSDDKLVLTLPDAMTPVVWMIDTRESGSFFMRVEKDDNGLYILQKIENSGKNVRIEDIAYYVDKDKAVKAMMMVGQVMDGKDRNSQSGSVFGKILKWVFIILFIALLYLTLTLIGGIRDMARENMAAQTNLTENQAPAAQDRPFVVDDPGAVGVPMSADKFMEKQDSTLRLPF